MTSKKKQNSRQKKSSLFSRFFKERGVFDLGKHRKIFGSCENNLYSTVWYSKGLMLCICQNPQNVTAQWINLNTCKFLKKVAEVKGNSGCNVGCDRII